MLLSQTAPVFYHLLAFLTYLFSRHVLWPFTHSREEKPLQRWHMHVCVGAYVPFLATFLAILLVSQFMCRFEVSASLHLWRQTHNLQILQCPSRSSSPLLCLSSTLCDCLLFSLSLLLKDMSHLRKENKINLTAGGTETSHCYIQGIFWK